MTDPAPDPFEHFGEQELCWSAARKYRDDLVARARQLYAMDPAEGAAGLVLLAGSPIGKALADAEPTGKRPDPDRTNCVTAMPRADFELFLKNFAPQLAAALPEADPPWQRKERKLPILVQAKNVARLDCTTFDVE